MEDPRAAVFKSVSSQRMTAVLTADAPGTVSGMGEAVAMAEGLDVRVEVHVGEGSRVGAGDVLMRLRGVPMALAKCEDALVGCLAKPSGVATAAASFNEAAAGRLRVVCGAWKKLPQGVRGQLRKAAATGGVGVRLLDEPMLYLDKNYVGMLGGIRECLTTLRDDPELAGRRRVVQVRGTTGDLAEEIWEAAEFGADVVFVDTGSIDDLDRIADALPYMRHVPEFAFAGGVTLADIDRIASYPVSYVGVGRAILDAPLLDMSFDVIAPPRLHECLCA